MANPIDRDRVEKAARIYHTNKDAAQAMGIHPQSFGRLCRKYGIVTPTERGKKGRKESAPK